MGKTITRKTTDGLLWNALQKFVSKGLQFLFSILIARILNPEQYGLIAIANLFISLSDVLIDSGFSKALLRKETKSSEEFSTVFWFNLAVSCFLYLILFASAPFISRFYNSELLIPIIRVVSISLIINALCGIQSLRLVAFMDFRKLAILESIAMILGGIAGLVAALQGAGVWALVLQTLIGCSLRTILIWFFSNWKPTFAFSIPVFKDFFAFGSRLLISEFAGRAYGAVFTSTIGKCFPPYQLGLYGKADAFASAPSSIITGPLSYVTFPAIAEIQNEEERMEKNFFSMFELSSFVVFPVFLGIAAVAKIIVPVFLTEKWNDMIPYLQILSVSYLLYALTVIPQNYLLILGESKLILRIQLITKAIGLALLFPLSKISLAAICYDILLVSLFTLCLTLLYFRAKTGYKISKVLYSLFPSFSSAISMAAIVIILAHLISNEYIGLFVCVIAGIAVYTLLSWFYNRKQLKNLWLILYPYLPKRGTS